MSEFQVNKSKLTESRIINSHPAPIGEGQVRVNIDKFAFTANNITYAVMGEQLRYWAFFQAQDDIEKQWGIIPVWGFADVVESNSDDIVVGERLFGYFPPAQTLLMTPSNVANTTFIEATEHRSSLPTGYNLYRRVSAEPNYDPHLDDERMLLFVLHLTSFCIQNMLNNNDWFGAKQVVVISASSKTSIGLGYGLRNDPEAPSAIGLTSPRNLDFVKRIGAYNKVLDYDDIKSIDASLPTAIVDMSANASLLSKLHSHLGDNMRFTSNVGLTHWDEAKKVEGIIAERSQPFFAPSIIQQRIKDWGHAEFDRRSMTYIAHSVEQCRGWMQIKTLNGLDDLATIYKDVCDGSIAPDNGLVVKM